MANKARKISIEKINEVIGQIYESALTGNWQDFLTFLLNETKSNKVFFILQKLDEPSPLIIEYQANFDYSEAVLFDYMSRPYEDPFYLMLKDKTEGEYYNINDFIDISEHVTTEYYQSIFKPMKTYYAIGGVLCRDGIHESAYAANRGVEDEPYDASDLALLEIITPHLSRAIHIYKELRLYKNYSNISKSILDQQDYAVLVCDDGGRIIINNAYAVDKLSNANDSLVQISNSKIKIAISAYQARLDHYIRQCTQLSYKEIGTQENIIVDSEHDDTILITVSPLLNKNTFNDIQVPCCLVTIKFQQQFNWGKIQNEFNLTRTEIKLLKAITAKKKLNDLVDVFNVTYNTLRTHLQNVFSKMRVNSQTELMVKINLFK